MYMKPSYPVSQHFEIHGYIHESSLNFKKMIIILTMDVTKMFFQEKSRKSVKICSFWVSFLHAHEYMNFLNFGKTF